MVKNPPAMQGIWVWSLGQKDPLEKGMATHSSILALIIPRKELPGGYSPWNHKESDMTEQLTLSLSFFSHIHIYTCMHPKLLQSCMTLCDPMDYSLPGFSVHGKSTPSRQEYWSGLPWLPPGYLPNPGIKPASLKSPALADRFLMTSTTWQDPTCIHTHQYITRDGWEFSLCPSLC